jgi:hypothetical protein
LDAQIKPSFHFTEDDGLAGNMVRDIIRDKNGLLWIATNNGISKFDGDKFVTINMSNGLPSNSVFALTVDETNTIYAGCYQGGLAIIKNDSVRKIIHQDTEYPETYRKLFYSQFHKKVIVGTDDGIYLLQDTVLMPVEYSKDKSAKSIILSISGQGEKLFFTALKGKSQGLYQLYIDNVHNEKSYAKMITANARFTSMIMSDTLYAGEYNNIFKYNLNEIPNRKPKLQVDSTFFIWSMSPYINNKYWLGGMGDGRFKGDIFQFDVKKNSVVSFPIKQNNQTVYTIFHDTTSSTTWFCRDNGLTSYAESPFEFFNYTGNCNILDIGYAGDSLMILTENDLCYLKNNKIVPFSTKINITNKIISQWNKGNKKDGMKFQLLFDTSRSCELVSFTQNGSNLYINTAMGSISVPDLKTYLPFGVGTFNLNKNGAYYFINYNPLRFFPSINDSIGNITPMSKKGALNNIFEIIESKGTFYFASTDNGLYCINNGNVFNLDKSNSKLDNSLTDIDVDSQGNIWCSSGNGNLFEIGFKDSLYVKRELELSKCGLIGNNCKWLKFNKGYLYMGTNKGLNIISTKNLVAENPSIEHFFNNYNGYDFISATSPIIDQAGNLYVHTLNQIIKIDTTFIHNSIQSLNLFDVMVNGQKSDISMIAGKNLPFSKKQISFKFNAIKYPLSRNISYRYKINNEAWISDNQITLQSLRSGNYEILLEAFDKENFERYSKVISFAIKTPFWQTVWFLSLLGIILMLVVFFVMRIRIVWLRKEHEKNTKLVIFNSELRLRSLQLQMNPHFIFNALQPLQGFILAKNVDEGLTYIANLAGVIRSNLENASEEFIHLATEIEFLKKYVEIEKIRFKDKLHVEFNNEVADCNLLLPPMLIQPIIENALKHGILNGKKKGLIKVDFSQNKNSLIVTVEDNGVGREYTKKLNKREHTNKGIEIINQRLHLLNNRYSNDFHQIEFTDLYADEKPAGTRVVIHVMLKHAE